jgi:HJR/Mrr/RecB family endonuclease
MALLHAEYLSACVQFSCLNENGKPLPVSQWGTDSLETVNGDPASWGPILSWLEAGEAHESGDGLAISIPNALVAGLSSFQTRTLGLPPVSDLRLKISTSKPLASPNFEISYSFAYSDGVPANEARREGIRLILGKGKQKLLMSPLYEICQDIDQYRKCPIGEMDERFLWWSRLVKLLSPQVEVSAYMRRMHIVRPERFSLDFRDEKGNLRIVPRFLGTSLVADGQEEEIYRDLLFPKAAQAFNSFFEKELKARGRYALNNAWFVVLPAMIQAAIEVVREVNREPREARLAFLQNPRLRLAKGISKATGKTYEPDGLDSLFIETPLFLSERIRYLGEWQTKAGLYFKTESGKWLPGEEIPTINLPLDNEVVSIASPELPQLIQDMEAALERGEESLVHQGRKLPVNQGVLGSLQEAYRVLAPALGPEAGFPSKEPENEEQSPEKGAPEVPIIFDNLDQLGAFRQSKGRREVKDCRPALLAEYKLQSHQEKGFSWLKKHWLNNSPGALLADDMGLGKTLQSLVFLSWIRQQPSAKGSKGMIKPILLVAPTGLLSNWEQEYEKFLEPRALGVVFRAHGKSLRDLMTSGRAEIIQYLEESGLVLTTYETLRDKISIFIGIDWLAAVFDEVQKLKNPRAMMTDMAKSIKAEFSLALTGTPVENSLADLWCIMDLVQPGHLGTLKDFAGEYIPQGRTEQEHLLALKKELEKPEGYPILMRRNKEEHWNERPGCQEILHKETMPSAQAQVYSDIVNRAQNSQSRRGAMLEALQGLRSASLHPFPQDYQPDNPEAFINASARLRILFEQLDQLSAREEKALIFLEYREMQGLLAEIVSRRYGIDRIMIINGAVTGPKRQEKVNRFQKSRFGFDVMILSPKAGGVGLNLTAATHVFHLTRWWNPAVEDQCSDRAYRIGQTRQVTIHQLQAIHPAYGIDHSFDCKLHDLLCKKRDLSRTLLLPPVASDADTSELFKGTVTDTSDRIQLAAISEELASMEPVEFEEWVRQELRKQGWQAQLTPTSWDGGADIVVWASPQTGDQALLLQCKHTQTNAKIGPQAVKEVLHAREGYSHLGGRIGLGVVTNGPGYTESARELARKNQVTLLSGENMDFGFLVN